MTRDPYTVLGISKTAGEQEIKKAYRKLARQYHPDVNHGNRQAEEKFKEVTNAYNFLSDKEQRAKYDRGEIDADGRVKGFSGGAGGGGYGFGGFGADAGFDGFSGFSAKSYRRSGMDGGFDFFSSQDNSKGGGFSGWSDFFDAFKGSRGKARTQKTDGANVTYTLNVPFVDAALGSVKEISLANGKKIKVKIPAGTDNNSTLRLKGEGMAGVGGGKTGDAMITVKVTPHPVFERVGNDISVKLSITLKEAVLGAKLPVPTLDGTAMVKIPPNTSNTILRLRGKGVKTSSGTGDLLVKVNIVLPSGYDGELEKFVKNWKGADYLVRR